RRRNPIDCQHHAPFSARGELAGVASFSHARDSTGSPQELAIGSQSVRISRILRWTEGGELHRRRPQRHFRFVLRHAVTLTCAAKRGTKQPPSFPVLRSRCLRIPKTS